MEKGCVVLILVVVIVGCLVIGCPIAIVIGVVQGISQYHKTPKPPSDSDYQYRKWWYNGGWEEVQAQQREEKEREILHNKILVLLNAGQKMDAIKEYKDYYECSLSKAKAAISEIEWEIEYERYHDDESPFKKGRSKSEEPSQQRLGSIDGMEGHQFERFCAELLRKSGFSNVSVTPGSGDQGVDILAEKEGVRYAIQCKNYATPLGNTPVQEVNAGKIFYNCHVGVVMTNSTFTSGAKELAKATGILLWDRRHIEEVMEKTEIQPAED